MSRVRSTLVVLLISTCFSSVGTGQVAAPSAAVGYDDVQKEPSKHVGKRVSWVGEVNGSFYDSAGPGGWTYLLQGGPSDGKLRPFRVLEPTKSTEAATKAGFGFGKTFLISGTVKQVVDIEMATGPTTRQVYKGPLLVDATLDIAPARR